MKPPGAGRDGRPARQLSLRTLLPATLSILVVLAAAPVIVIGYLSATGTAERLLTERADMIVDGLENQIRAQLDPVVDQLGYARQVVMDGLIDADDPETLRTFALGVLAGTPQVFGVGVIGQDLSMRRWERESFAEYVEPPYRLPLAAAAIDAARDGRAAYWAAPFVSVALGDTILNYRVSLERNGDLLGVLAIGVTSEGLSRYVEATSDQFQVTAFVLAGRDRVITHPGWRARVDDLSSTDLPPVSTLDDPVIARIWDNPQPLVQTSDLARSQGHWSRIDGVAYAYYYRELTDYGPEPLVVGVAVPSADTWWTRWSATIAAAVGAALTVIGAAVAWHLGRALSRPAAAIGAALDAIGNLEFEKVSLPHLVASRVREWRSMALRIEGTSRALLAFQTYLPRALVRRIFRVADDGIGGRERDVTVMFLDLEGFTAFARGRSARDVATHLNAVFARVGPIIEASGGVIDKYTGDGLLAFWGAPDAQPNHRARAADAAARIAHVFSMPGAGRAADGPRLRIGLHAGPAIVGNIGFPGRIDYTLTGDTVNVANRTQSAVRGFAPDAAVVIAATQAVFDGPGDAGAVLVKVHALPGAPQQTFFCRPTATTD